jgi:hypothetical protein
MKRISLVALLAALPLALASPAASVGKRSFHDAFGDVNCCTRDLTDVDVRNDDAGTITFDIHFDATYEGDDDDDLYVFLDTDRNPRTGERYGDLGVDFMIGAHVMPWMADAVTLNEHPTKLIHVTVTSKLIRIRLDRHLLGDTDGFRFKAAVWEVAQGNAYADVAPDGGSWSFPLRIATRRLRPSLEVTSKPRAGRRLTARLALPIGGTGRLLGSGRVLCSASIRGAGLKPAFQGFAARRAVCTWKIPAGAHGKTIRGSVGVAVTSRARISRRFSAVIG